MATGMNEGTGNMGQRCCCCVGRSSDRIGALLRCFVVGLLTLFVWAAATDEWGGYSAWIGAAGAIAVGALIYSLHVCVLARIMWRPLIVRLHLLNEKHPWIEKEQRELAKTGTDKLLLDLSVARLRRRISQDEELRSVQKGLDRWRGMGGFLYCAGYVMIAVPLIVRYLEVGVKVEDCDLLNYLIILGGVALLGAVISDSAEAWHEFWATATYKTERATRPRRRTR